MSFIGLSLGKNRSGKSQECPSPFSGQIRITCGYMEGCSSILAGGISIFMQQAFHPLELAGIWDYPTFREDMTGPPRRAGLFISGTIFGSRQGVEWLLEKVCAVHLQIICTTLAWVPYALSDPNFLTWVHVDEVNSFL